MLLLVGRSVAALLLVAGLVGDIGAASAQTVAVGTFKNEGPGPVYNNFASASVTAPGTTSGAIQAVLANPGDARQMIIGTTNGGIWSTTDGGANWTPLTDNKASLSIASLAYNSTNASVIYAGIGQTDNGLAAGQRGGTRLGLMQSTDGGTTWSALPKEQLGPLSAANGGSGLSVVGVAGYTLGGNATILAATWEAWTAADSTSAKGYGLYRSVNGGAFVPVNDGTGVLPKGAATSLVGQGTAISPYYVAITGDTPTSGGVFRSSDGGTTWSQVLSIGSVVITNDDKTTTTRGLAGRLAVGPNGSVAVAIFNPYSKSDGNTGGGQMTSLQLSQTGATGSWVEASKLPPVNGGGQAFTNLAIAVDPSSSSTVYVAGDAITAEPFTLAAYRMTFGSTSSTMDVITDSGTGNGSTVHADARVITFDQTGRMLLSSDGGIYALTSPRTGTGAWSSLNGNLQLREAYGLAYDAVSHRLVVAAQDNGVALQNAARAAAATQINGGDGIVAAVNDRTHAADGESIIYHSTQNFGNLTRQVLNASGTIVSTTPFGTPSSTNPILNFAPADFTEAGDGDPDNGKPGGGKALPFSSQLVLNRADPSKIVLGTNFVYVTTDERLTGESSTPLTNVVNLSRQPNGLPGGVSALAYGVYGYNATVDPNGGTALLVGARGIADDDPAVAKSPSLWFSATGDAGTLTQLAYGGKGPTSAVFGTQSKFFYVADGEKLWTSIDGGTTITEANANVLKNDTNLNVRTPTAVEFINKNGVNALLVGGLNGWDGTSPNSVPPSVNSASPIAVSLVDAAGNLKPGAPFGSGLPNTFASNIVFNPTADVLAVSLYGRGIWTLYDVTSYFSTATTLVFGSADNDSTPSGNILTNGVDIDGNTFARGLRKEGAGKLTIGSLASYSGGTTVNAGTLVLTGAGTLGSTAAATTINGGTLDLGTTTQTQNGGLTLTGGTLQNGTFQSSGPFAVQDGSVAAVLAGAGNLTKSGDGTVVLSGANTYTGSTTVTGGILRVNGSIAASSGVTVGPDGVLSGSGTVPVTAVNGFVAPNNPGGVLTVNTSYTQNLGSTYEVVTVASGASDRLQVNGPATLAGTVAALPTAGSYGRSKTFTILTANSITGTYGNATSSLPFLLPTLSYDATSVFLTLTPGGFVNGAATPNQAAVARVLDANVATAGGDFLTVIDAFSMMTTQQAQAAFQAISGQNYSGFATLGVQTAQLFMNFFANQVGGGGGSNGGSTRVALAEACDVACDSTAAPRWSAWGGPLGGLGTIAGSANALGQTFNIGGFAAGLDRRFDGGFLAGVTAGYTTANTYTQTMPGQGSAQTFQLGLYGEYANGAFYLDALGGYARTNNQMTRPIFVTGLAARTALGNTSTDQFFGQLEAGYRIALGGPADPFVTPFARLQGSTATQAGFSETGAGSLDLTVAAQTTNSLRSVLGVQAGAAFDIGWRDKLGLALRLGWSHEYADTARPVNASFAGAPASPFTVFGAATPRDGAILGLAADTRITEATSVYLRYDGELAGGTTSHVFSAGLRIVW